MALLNLTIEAEKTENCRNLARDVFQRKYKETIFTIMGPFVNDVNNEISEDDKRSAVILRSFSMFKKVFNVFGNLIQYFKIYFDYIDSAIGQEIVKYINECCTDSLKMLTLEDCKENVLDDLNKTFPNVLESTFSISSSQKLVIRENTQPLNELFPALNQLQIEYTRASDWKKIGYEFPQLKCVHVNLPKLKVAELPDETFVVHLIENSPEIKHFSIKHSSLMLLKEVNEILPQLDNLELHYLAKNYSNFCGDTINFENVIGLTVFEDQSDYKIPEKIHFHRLEQLTLNLQPEFTDTWIDFISKQLNQTITTFNLTVGILSNEHLLNIPIILPNLETVVIRCGTDFTAGEIMTFLSKSEHLKNVEMIIQMEKIEVSNLRSKLQGKWRYAIHPARRRVKINLER